jgi:hypothetical protein
MRQREVIEGFFTCQKNEKAFKALQRQRAPHVQWAGTKASPSRSQAFKGNLSAGDLWVCTPLSPAVASDTVLLWPGLDSRFWSLDLSLFPWQPCVSHICFLADASGFSHSTPPCGSKLSYSQRPSFNLAHATSAFQLPPFLCLLSGSCFFLLLTNPIFGVHVFSMWDWRPRNLPLSLEKKNLLPLKA